MLTINPIIQTKITNQIEYEEEDGHYSGSDDDDEYTEEDYDSDNGFVVKD